jgi:hypothetical protein
MQWSSLIRVDGAGDGVGVGVGDPVGPFGGVKFEVTGDCDPPQPARMQSESSNKTATNFAVVMGAPYVVKLLLKRCPRVRLCCIRPKRIFTLSTVSTSAVNLKDREGNTPDILGIYGDGGGH